MVKLGDVCDILNGYAFKSDKYVDDGIRIIRISNVQKGFIEDNTPVFYPINDSEAKKYTLSCGDLLMSLTGNVGRVGIVTDELLPAALNQRVACLRVKDKNLLNKFYLYHMLNSDSFEQKCSGSAKGVAQKNMSTEWLKECAFELPPISMQHEIVCRLDKVSDMIALRKQQLAKLDKLVKARFVELFGDTKNNEHKWKTLPLYKVLESGSSVSYGIVQTGDDIEGGIPVFRPIDIAGGKIPQREQLKRTAIDISNQYSRTLLKGYELLITVRGSVGETFRVTSDFAGCNVGRNIVPLRFDTTIVDYSFMLHFFAQEGTKRVLESMTKGIALQGLNMSEFREIDVIIPNMSLQQQFAAFIEQTDKSKLTIQNSLVKLELLKKVIMQKNFG